MVDLFRKRSAKTNELNDDDHPSKRPQRKDHTATGASAAGVRAISVEFMRFYFRAPIKAFFRNRVDYMGYARAINPRVRNNEAWSFKMTTPGILAHAVQQYGWSFIPKHVIPPLLANATVGAVLYTSYLQILGKLHEPSSRSSKRVYPPPSMLSTFLAGFAAGSIQSIVAAPVDALQTRFNSNQMLQGRYTSVLHYAIMKLNEIGVRGVFAGWTLSLLKDSIGNGVFFMTFETVKSQGYYSLVAEYYGDLQKYPSVRALIEIEQENGHSRPILRPHYALEPAFLLLAGVCASVAQQLVQYPLAIIQSVHYSRLEKLDAAAQSNRSGRFMLRSYLDAYSHTLAQCKRRAHLMKSWRHYLYRGFLSNTVRQAPSTSAGLIVFELVRRRYAWDTEEVLIRKDGYDILLT